jgi:type I restriction enzyme S subunit
MKWSSVKVGSIRAGARHSLVGGPFGSDLTTRDYVDDGVPVIRGSNLPEDRSFNDDDFVFVREEKADQLIANNAYSGDVVFTQRGTLGQVGLIPSESRFPRYLISQSQMKLTVDRAKADARFVYYYFRHPDTVQNIKNHAITSGVPHINLGLLRDFEMPLPSVGTQRDIVAILSAYDDLIENNRRRMALLEESARLLYREWFVRLRFPGHEHTRIVDGLPEGWGRKPLAESCESIDYGYTASAEDEDIGPKFLRITDIVPDFIDWSTVPHCQIEEDRLEKFRLLEGDIVIARTGATVGYAKRINKRQPDAVFASYLVRLRMKAAVDSLMVGVFVESEDYKKYVQSRVGGAAQPNANAKVLSAVDMMVPTQRLQREFREIVEPLADQRETLQEQNQKLKAARDLLLPKLMNGEIIV